MFKSVIAGGLLIITACGVAAAEQPNVTAILDAAIKADGGEATLGKIVGLYLKYKMNSSANGNVDVAFYEEWLEKDKERTLTFDKDHVPVNTEVVNGSDGWGQDWGQQTDTMPANLLKARQETIYECWITTNFVDLKGKEHKLSVLPEIDVGGHKAVGILVEREKHTPVKLYFDKQTHLLSEMRSKINDVEPDKSTEHDQQCICSDYRDVQGTKQPFKVEVLWDGAKIADMDFETQKLSDKPFEKQLFIKP